MISTANRALIKKAIPLPIRDNLVIQWSKLRIRFRNFRANPPIIIYQMGKVGSKTIQVSLENAKLSNPIYHVHYLSQEGIKSAEEYFLRLQPTIPRFIRFCTILRQKIERDRAKVNWRIITLVREQIAWEISNFFENVDLYWPHLVDEKGRVRKKQAIDFLCEKFKNYDETTDYVSMWFDRELKRAFDFDVYAYPFNHQDGFIVVSEGNLRILILRLEDLSRSFDKAILEFLGLDKPIKMIKANIAQERQHAEEYRGLLDDITIPKSICARIYTSKYAEHFYTESMRNQFIQKWSRE